MSKYIFQIPSHDRLGKLTTLDILTGFGIPKEDIWMCVHESEYDAYSHEVSDRVTLMQCEENNVGAKRHLLLSKAKSGQRVVILDDDILAFQTFVSEKEMHTIETREEFYALLDYCFSFAESHNAMIWGTYPAPNPYFMSKSIDLKNICIATMMGVTAGVFNFTKDSALKEDYDLCLKSLYAGLNCVRFNFILADTNHRTPGGAHDEWKSGKDEVVSKTLCRRYPMFLKYSETNASRLKFTKAERYKGKIEWYANRRRE